MRTTLFALAATGLATACFTPVGEAQCATDADCSGGLACIDFRCRAPDGGAAGGLAGGTAGGGATAGGAGGGVAGGTAAGGGAGGGATAGGSGGSGGSGGGGALDAGTCGCRTGGGQCLPGDSPLACGAGGAQCMRCGMGQQCVNGACVMAACGPGTCSGCCGQNFCVTPSQQSSFACGVGGSMCSQCPRGQDCVNGACQQAQPCGPMTCASGCCAFGRCVTQQTNLACGVAGAMCQQCGIGTTCRGGVCVPNTLMDGGTPPTLPAGSACTAMSPCDGFCLEETSFGQPTGFPGGYCTATCGPTQPCASGACIPESVFGVSSSSCRSTCPGPGFGQSTCRTGYVCALSPSPGTLLGYCRPNCNNGGLAACPTGQQCQASGVCL